MALHWEERATNNKQSLKRLVAAKHKCFHGTEISKLQWKIFISLKWLFAFKYYQ